MRKEGYCAYGAGVVYALLEHLQPSDREALFRLQVCLSLFRECYPKRRIGFWKRRIRRCLRVMNALNDHKRLMEWVERKLIALTHPCPPSPDASEEGGSHTPLSHSVGEGTGVRAKPGIERVQLRLKQRIEQIQQRADSAWQSLIRSRTLNEIRGLSKRWAESHSHEAPCPTYLTRQWGRFQKEHLPSLHSAGMALELRWGRLHALTTGAEILAPLLHNPAPQEWHDTLHQIERERFKAIATHILQTLWVEERTQTEQYYGHTRPLQRLKPGWDYLLEKLEEDFA